MNRIITIGREFGSGGRELGRRLSEKLNIAYYDQEIISEISKRTALSEEYIRRITESRPTVSFPIHIGRSFSPVPDPLVQQRISVYSEQNKLLHELADKSDCIIVGRCADVILKDYHPLNLFVYADAESKIQRCIDRAPEGEHLSRNDIARRMKQVDKNRAQYRQMFADSKWGAKETYHLCVNTSGHQIKDLTAFVRCWYGEK